MGKIALCADSESLIRPWMIGLEGVDLETVEWVVAFSRGEDLRTFLRKGSEVDEVWIASSDDISSINLAAALHKDNATIPILLVIDDASGSMMSRAKAAGISDVILSRNLSERFGVERNRRARMQEAARIHTSACSPSPAPVVNGSPRYRADQTVPYPVVVDDGVMAIDEPTRNALHTTKGDADENSAQGARGCKSNIRQSDAFIMSVVSGSGGAGKSAVSSVAAGLSVARGFNTLLLDCDLQFGDMKYLFGMDNAPTIDDALSDPTYLGRLSEESAKQNVPALVIAPARLESSETLAGYVGGLLDECTNHFDSIILNTGSNWSDLHAELLERSSCTLFLIDQRASSVHACRHAMELCLRMGIATGSFSYAINRCGRNAMFGATEISSILNSARIFELKDGGQEVEETLGAGLALELAESKNDFSRSINAMLSEVMNPFGATRGTSMTRKKLGCMAGAGQLSINPETDSVQMIGSHSFPYEISEPTLVQERKSSPFRLRQFGSGRGQLRRRGLGSKREIMPKGAKTDAGSMMRMEIR